MGDRVAVLKRGLLMQVDAPQVLYDHPDNLFVAGFIGSPAMNLCEGTLARTNGQTVVEFGSFRLTVPDAAIDRYTKVPDYVGKQIAVGLRPEHFTRAEGAPEDRTLEVTIDLIEALGSDLVVHFSTDTRPIITEDMREAVDDADAFAEIERRAAEGGQSFIARLEPRDIPKPGQSLKIAFDTDQLHFFDYDNGIALR